MSDEGEEKDNFIEKISAECSQCGISPEDTYLMPHYRSVANSAQPGDV